MADFTRKEIIEKIMNHPKPINFSGVDFSTLNLAGLDFSETILNSSKLFHCEINELNLKKAHLENVLFESTSGIPFFGTTVLKNCGFTLLENSDFGKYNFEFCSLDKVFFIKEFSLEVPEKLTKSNLNFKKCTIGSINFHSDLEITMLECDVSSLSSGLITHKNIIEPIPDRLGKKYRQILKIKNCKIASIDFFDTDTYGSEMRNNEFSKFCFNEINGSNLKISGNKFQGNSDKFQSGSFNNSAFESGSFSYNSFVGGEFSKCTFLYTEFDSNKIKNSFLISCQFKKLRFRRNQISKHELDRVDFEDCEVESNEFENVKIVSSKYIDSKIIESKFLNSEFSNTVFKKVHLIKCEFKNVIFKNCDLSNLEIDDLTKFENIQFIECEGAEKINVINIPPKKKSFWSSLLGE